MIPHPDHCHVTIPLSVIIFMMSYNICVTFYYSIVSFTRESSFTLPTTWLRERMASTMRRSKRLIKLFLWFCVIFITKNLSRDAIPIFGKEQLCCRFLNLASRVVMLDFIDQSYIQAILNQCQASKLSKN